jgi:D-arabinose 1-dehydrogenase-like Zn-dependent alcohol dehydrogenase
MAPQHSALAAAAAAALAAVLFLRRHRAATPPPLPVPSTMMAVIARDGKLVVEKAWPTPVPSAGEVLIRVRTTSINRLDTVQRKGFAKPPPGATEVLGLECAGEVAASGAGVSFRPGDRVMALLPGGGYAEYVSVSALTVMRMPAHLSWAEAGSIAEAWLTAYQLVVLTAGVQPGDVVLIHAACSGVGLAAIQIVTGVLGATAVVTVGSRQKLELCVAHGAVGGAAHTEGEWAAKVSERHACPGTRSPAAWRARNPFPASEPQPDSTAPHRSGDRSVSDGLVQRGARPGGRSVR